MDLLYTHSEELSPLMPKFGTYVFDISQWPLLYIGIHGSIDDPTCQAFADALGEVARRDEPYIVLVNSVEAHVNPPAQRKMFAELVKSSEEMSRRRCAGVVLLLQGQVLHGALTAILWLSRPQFPIKAVIALEDMRASLHAQATAKALSVPCLGSAMELATYVNRVDGVGIPQQMIRDLARGR
jgi:hypothetical protein